MRASKIIVAAEIEVALLFLGEIVDVEPRAHSRPSAVGHGRIECRQTDLGIIDTGDRLCGGVAVSAVDVVLNVELFILLVFVILHGSILSCVCGKASFSRFCTNIPRRVDFCREI